MDKVERLKQLELKIRANTSLPLMESNLVFGEGNPDCSVMFIGEAPGATEDQLGRPFVGRAGKLLDQLIEEIGWKREDVYISNIVKRRPPENRDPLPEEIEAYKPFLAEQIEIINPKVIAPLGRFSMNYFLPFAKISRDQGKIFKIEGRIVYPLFHPAAALRNPTFLAGLRTAFKGLPDAVTKTTVSVAPAPAPAFQKKDGDTPQSSLF